MISFFSGAGLLLTAAIWGFAFVIVKDSLDYIGHTWMVAFRFTIAAIAMSLIFLPKFKEMNLKTLKCGAITGAMLFGGYLTQTIGCNYTTAGKNAFFTTIYVILIPLICWPLYKKRPKWHVWVAAVMSVTGLGILALGSEDKGINIGDIWTLACGFFYAIHIIWTNKYNNEGVSTILLSVLQFAFAGVFGWILAPFLDGAFPVSAFTAANASAVGGLTGTAAIIVSMLYLGLFSSALAFSLQNVGLKYVNPSLASLFLGFESVFGILFSTLFLHEAFTLKMLFGCALIFGAVLLAELKEE